MYKIKLIRKKNKIRNKNKKGENKMKTKIFLTTAVWLAFTVIGSLSFAAVTQNSSVNTVPQQQSRAKTAPIIQNGYFVAKIDRHKTAEIHIKTIVQDYNESFTLVLLTVSSRNEGTKARLFKVTASESKSSLWSPFYQTQDNYLMAYDEVFYTGRFTGTQGKRTLTLTQNNTGSCNPLPSSRVEFREEKSEAWESLPSTFQTKTDSMVLDGNVLDGDVFNKTGAYYLERLASNSFGTLRAQKASQYTAAGYDLEANIHALVVFVDQELLFIEVPPRETPSCWNEEMWRTDKKKKRRTSQRRGHTFRPFYNGPR